jgi:hypothetical protein
MLLQLSNIVLLYASHDWSSINRIEVHYLPQHKKSNMIMYASRALTSVSTVFILYLFFFLQKALRVIMYGL